MRMLKSEPKCDMCLKHNAPRLWQCTECSLSKHVSPQLCDSCIVNTHINNPHCMNILSGEGTVFRKPFANEFITFQLDVLKCSSCSYTNCFQSEQKYVKYVFIASQNGIFHCTIPEEVTVCQHCGNQQITSPVAFNCLPCDPVLKSGCTWFTNSLLSFTRTL